MRQQPFREIARELTRRVREGIYAPDSALPPRLELMREFGVARATLDRAIRELMSDGVLIGRHGSGTYVNGSGVGRRRVAVIGGINPEEDMGTPFDLTVIPVSELKVKSAWKRLFDFDGLLWMRPEAELLPVIDAVGGQLPQVLVNRVHPGTAYVSTDHRGAYHAITKERLALYPAAKVFFLRSSLTSLALDYRFDGFVDACREQGRFYELLHMPTEFEAKLALLHERIPVAPGEMRILVADARAHTGAVMRFAAERAACWKRELLYSDFDNDYGRDVWGVEVTSFLQEPSRLFREAAAKLGRMLEGGDDGEEGVLIAPERRDGDT